MDVAIKKVGMRDRVERFVLVNAKTREVITVRDVSESALRRYFQRRKVPQELIERCIERARQRYADTAREAKVDESADTRGDDDLLFELGLDDDASVH